MAGIKLQDREKRVLTFGGIAAAAILIFVVVEGPYRSYSESGAKLEQARDRLRQAEVIHAGVLRKREEEAFVNSQLRPKPGFDLLTFVNSAVQERGLSTRATIDNTSGGAVGSWSGAVSPAKARTDIRTSARESMRRSSTGAAHGASRGSVAERRVGDGGAGPGTETPGHSSRGTPWTRGRTRSRG